MKHLFILIMLSLLSACDINHDKDLPPGTIKNIGIYKPEVNKHPQYWATFNGFIDPKLENKVPLRIFAVYESNNTKCQYIRNRLDGISYDRSELVKATILPSMNSQFTYQVPLDLYTPGFCQWKIRFIGFQDNYNPGAYDSNVLAYFDEVESHKQIKTKFSYDFLCDINDFVANPRPCGFNSYLDRAHLPINKNYKFIINLKKKSDER